MISITKITFIALLISCSLAQIQKPGNCPQPKVIENFNVTEYLGVWYEQVKYPAPFETNGKCSKAEYTLGENNNVRVVNSMIDKTSQILLTIEGTAKVIENAKLLVKFPSSPETKESSNYWVLDTDYKSFTVIFSCTQISSTENYQIVWILTRARNVPNYLVEIAKEVLVKNGISINELEKTDQVQNCYN